MGRSRKVVSTAACFGVVALLIVIFRLYKISYSKTEKDLVSTILEHGQNQGKTSELENIDTEKVVNNVEESADSEKEEEEEASNISKEKNIKDAESVQNDGFVEDEQVKKELKAFEAFKKKMKSASKHQLTENSKLSSLETEKIKQEFHWGSEDVDSGEKGKGQQKLLNWILPEHVQRDGARGHRGVTRQVVFFKTHRTGGSTIQNVLMRYGDTHNLVFALPKVGTEFYVFNERKVLPVPGRHFDILCHSMSKYAGDELHALMPISSRFVTILRNPVQTFESAFQYYDFAKCFGFGPLVANPLEEFLRNPQYAYSRIPHCGVSTKNPMLFDFGVAVPQLNDMDTIQRKIQEIENDFDLVMIADYMDESLILLKHKFGWKMEDIVYFSHNVRTENVHYNMETETKVAISKWNRGDVILYSHFLRNFLLRIKEFGHERLEQERDEFQRVRENWAQFCLERELLGGEMRHSSQDEARPSDLNAYGFVLSEAGKNSAMCQRLVREPRPYTKMLHEKMTALSTGHRQNEF